MGRRGRKGAAKGTLRGLRLRRRRWAGRARRGRLADRDSHGRAYRRTGRRRDAGAASLGSSEKEADSAAAEVRAVGEPTRGVRDVPKAVNAVGAELPLGEKTNSAAQRDRCRECLRTTSKWRRGYTADSDEHERNRGRGWGRCCRVAGAAAAATQKKGCQNERQRRSDNQASLPPHRASSYGAATQGLSRTLPIRTAFDMYRARYLPISERGQIATESALPFKKKRRASKEGGGSLMPARSSPASRQTCPDCWEEHEQPECASFSKQQHSNCIDDHRRRVIHRRESNRGSQNATVEARPDGKYVQTYRAAPAASIKTIRPLETCLMPLPKPK